MFFLCSHAYRKGAVCWWRRSCLCADGIRLSAIRLAERHPAPARRLGLALSMESERVGGNLTRDVLTQHLRDFRDLHPRMIARRVDKAIEASLHSTAPKQHVLNQCRTARIHAALHEPEAPQAFSAASQPRTCQWMLHPSLRKADIQDVTRYPVRSCQRTGLERNPI